MHVLDGGARWANARTPGASGETLWSHPASRTSGASSGASPGASQVAPSLRSFLRSLPGNGVSPICPPPKGMKCLPRMLISADSTKPTRGHPCSRPSPSLHIPRHLLHSSEWTTADRPCVPRTHAALLETTVSLAIAPRTLCTPDIRTCLLSATLYAPGAET